MKNILEYLEKTTKENAQKIAVIEEDKKCTYSELLKKSKATGSEILKHIEPREPVAIIMEKSIKALYTFFGTIYAGGFYCLLNPELPVVRLEKILEKLNTKIIITDSDNLELASQISNGQEILRIEEIQDTEIDEKRLQKIREQALDVDPLYANFTSGSTGTPKGVIVGNRSVIDFINIFTEKFNISNNDIIGNQAPFDFDVSVKDIYSSIKTGATLVIIPKRMFSRPAQLLDYLCENNVTTLVWAVSALCLITTFHGFDYKVPNKINKVLFSGEVMPIKHLKEWISYLPEAMYVNLYGPTEITCNCTYHIVDKTLPYEKQIPAGQTFDNEQVFLLNDENKLITQAGEAGEICVKGTTLALGYYNDKEQTNAKFIQNPLNDHYIDMIYKTGDLGYFDENKNLYFCGRKDFQIKHQGHRIELEEIERAMEKINGIERACCIYREEKSKIYGFYIGNVEKSVLHEQLKEELPVYMIPNVLKQIEEFPMNKNGKIDRKELRKYFN